MVFINLCTIALSSSNNSARKKRHKNKKQNNLHSSDTFPYFHPYRILFFKDFIYLFLERGEGRGKEGRKDQCMAARVVALTGDLACNTGMCPDWESNQQSLGWQASAQSTEPHQPGPEHFILYIVNLSMPLNEMFKTKIMYIWF